MTSTHVLGFPRIGLKRELKFALECYWRGEEDQAGLFATAAELRRQHWAWQREAGMDLLPVGDFSFYDHVLDYACMFGVVPARFGHPGGPVSLDTYFRMARGRAPNGEDVAACEMTKWFDTNYHYMVPEFSAGQGFALHPDALLAQVREARELGYTAKPVVLGPLSFLWLGKMHGEGERLDLLLDLLACYGDLLAALRDEGVEWVQIDEPILALDLPEPWRQAFERAYSFLKIPGLNLLLATYFGGLQDNLSLACALPTAGLHLDFTRNPDNVGRVLDALPPYKVLSAGVIDGRNIWRADLAAVWAMLRRLSNRLGERLWLASSCSLLHVPVDLDLETDLDSDHRRWLAFAKQKLGELRLLGLLLDGNQDAELELAARQAAVDARRRSAWVHKPAVQARLGDIDEAMMRREQPFSARYQAQQAHLGLPLFPTTTIGSFPQTADIRETRRALRQGEIGQVEYEARMKQAIAECIAEQEQLGLDVLVHGEPERNDMVEYFGEHLDGVLATRFGWVQSYGSRCVKPPIIAGDVTRPEPITVPWIRYAQSLTGKPVKGMLTGPVTMLQWSFVRDDQPRADTCRQLALCIRDEVADLEAAGTVIIQIDEPALREGLPLRQSDKQAYLDWAVDGFRLASGGARAATQIHTHMCYAEFHDILDDIARMDADVITLETARSAMELLAAFKHAHYDNAVGPGVYDIHSPVTPSAHAMRRVIDTALDLLPAERLWVNPDCGLKTRRWEEVRPALANMVAVARELRDRSSVPLH